MSDENGIILNRYLFRYQCSSIDVSFMASSFITIGLYELTPN